MLTALLLTLLAGGATSIGAAIGLLGAREDDRIFAMSLGLSAGVMLYVSFVELLPQGAAVLDSGAGAGMGGAGASQRAWALASIAFIGAMLGAALLDRLVPARWNPHEAPPGQADGSGARGAEAAGMGPTGARQAGAGPAQRALMLRTGWVMAVLLALHNVPEGFATFISALQEPRVAAPIVIATALHNIPEGIAVAAPIVRATGSRGFAFTLATVSGLAEPAGALVGWALLAPVLSGPALGAVLAAVAGIMVFVTLDTLLPAARAGGAPHTAMYALIAGMAVMAGTLVVLP